MRVGGEALKTFSFQSCDDSELFIGFNGSFFVPVAYIGLKCFLGTLHLHINNIISCSSNNLISCLFNAWRSSHDPQRFLCQPS